MNNSDFVLAADGWTQVTPCGEFPHAGAGVVQVIDRAACDAMAAEFNAADHRVGVAGHGALGARASGSGKLRRGRREAQRVEAAREAVLREQAREAEGKLNVQPQTLR